jgi:hypothetical protein
VPVALARPRLSGLWFLPTLLWSTHTLESDGEVWRLAIVFSTTAAVTWLCLSGVRRLQRASSAEGNAARAVPAG